jgi:tyrosine-protein kinase Etk/Wzc
MTAAENSQSSHSKPAGQDRRDFLDLLIVVAKHKRMIATITLAGALVAVIVALLLRNVYTATAKILPPQQNQSAAAMLMGQVAGLAALSGSTGLGIKNPTDLYIGMLKSRTIADGIIQRFDLQKLYEEATMVDARRVLASKSSITTGKEGLITIEFEDFDAKRAAAVANAYIEELEKLTRSLALTEAAQRRLFFEQQLRQTRDDLAAAEIALKVTQEKTGLIKLDDQGKAIIEAVAALRAQIAAKEVELRAMRTFATEQNSDYIRSQQQLAGLRTELSKLEQSKAVGNGDVFLPTGKVPEAGLEYVRRYREVKYYETIFELLARQFEIAKIDEAKEAAIVQIVDQAVVPDRKSKPGRTIIVIVATLSAGLASLLWALFREAHEQARTDPVQTARLNELRRRTSWRSRTTP